MRINPYSEKFVMKVVFLFLAECEFSLLCNAISVRITLSAEMFVEPSIHQFTTGETKTKHYLSRVKFLCSFSPGQIHYDINLLNLPEIFRNPYSVAVCMCASEVSPGLIFFSLLRHVEWHFTCLHFFPVFAMA